MEYLFVATKKGKIKKITPDDFRPMGRAAKGIMGMELEDGDEVVAITHIFKDDVCECEEPMDEECITDKEPIEIIDKRDE
jgi:DNA gyrase/topoisomerase IV subunit A